MIRFFPLLTLLLSFLASGLSFTVRRGAKIVENGPVRLPFAKRINTTSARNILKADRARAAARMARFGIHSKIPFVDPIDRRAVIATPIDNLAVEYLASVGIGSPATTYSLIVDTGSSNTWVGAGIPYVQTKTSVRTPNTVSVTYGSGFFSGTEFLDTVTIGSSLAFQQSIGVASTSEGFNGVDGVLGLGPDDLTLGTLSPNGSSEIPTVTDQLFEACQTALDVIGIFFQPSTSSEALNGELGFGGIDTSKIQGNLVFTPITEIAPSNEFWGIDQSIRYGTSTTIMNSTAGIVDSGTTLILIPDDAFQRYTEAAGGVPDRNTGLLRLTSSQFSHLQSLFFTIAGVQFEFTANAQAWPRALNALIGGTMGNAYLIVASSGGPSGQGLDFINGFAFIERFYTVFDSVNRQVGFANTAFTHATTN